MMNAIAGCPVCGYGVDWSWYPGLTYIETGTMLIYLAVNWCRAEWVCAECFLWAKAAGAEWDGTIQIHVSKPALFSRVTGFTP